MKKVLITLVVVVIAAVSFNSCASSKKGGLGCPTSNSNKPFRA